MRVLLLILAAVITVGAICLPICRKFSINKKTSTVSQNLTFGETVAFLLPIKYLHQRKKRGNRNDSPLSCCGEIWGIWTLDLRLKGVCSANWANISSVNYYIIAHLFAFVKCFFQFFSDFFALLISFSYGAIFISYETEKQPIYRWHSYPFLYNE